MCDQLRSYFAVTAKLICSYVFAYAKCCFSHGVALNMDCTSLTWLITNVFWIKQALKVKKKKNSLFLNYLCCWSFHLLSFFFLNSVLCPFQDSFTPIERSPSAPDTSPSRAWLVPQMACEGPKLHWPPILFDLWINILVNNFSVMSKWCHHFLGTDQTTRI